MTAVVAKQRRARSFRWPWQPAPGMVRISRNDLIELLRTNLRAVELELQAVHLEARRDESRRQATAAELVTAQARAAGVQFSALAIDGILADLPITVGGDLHVDAFLALLGQHILERRLSAGIPTTTGDDHR